MKRIIHYILLAAILLGTPLLCCVIGGRDELLEGVKAFPPRTEDGGLRPELLWNHKCPFSWWAFAGLTAFTALCLYPFLKRTAAALRTAWRSPLNQIKHPFPWWGWLGVSVMAAGWYLSWNRFEWFRPYQVMLSYMPIWAGFILLMNALCVRRSGHSPMTDHPLAYATTFPASSLFWWFFEYLNRYVWNWYYVGISDLSATEYTIYATICFASVLPAVAAVAAWLHTFPAFDDTVYSGMIRINLRRPGWCAFLGVLAMVGLTGIVFFPAYAYHTHLLNVCLGICYAIKHTLNILHVLILVDSEEERIGFIEELNSILNTCMIGIVLKSTVLVKLKYDVLKKIEILLHNFSVGEPLLLGSEHIDLLYTLDDLIGVIVLIELI